MLGSIHSMTHEHLQLGEGVLLRGVDAEGAMQSGDPAAFLAEALQDAAYLIGATKEGCVFRCAPALLDLTRGQRTPARGETLQGRWEATLSGTLLEVTPANAAMLLNAAPPAEAAGMLQPGQAAAPAHQDSVCWIGTTGSGLLAIWLDHPISTGGMTLRTSRSGMGEMPFTLRAQAADPAQEALPCRLLWLKEATV